MAHSREKFDPICGTRVKQVIEREGLTNRAFAKLVHLSEKTVSGMVNHRQKVTEATAREIVKAFPDSGYQVEWFLGLTDFMTQQEATNSILNNLCDNAMALDTVLINLLKLNGWTMRAIPNKDGYILENPGENKSFELDTLDIVSLRDDIQGYAKYRLERMFHNHVLREAMNSSTKMTESR